MSAKFGAVLGLCHTPMDETVTFAAQAISGCYPGSNAANAALLSEAAEGVAQKAKKIARDAGYDLIEVHIGHGDLAEDVLALAKKVKADLIVTGRRGLGDLRGLFLGSTSHSISKGAECAHLMVA